MNPNRKADWISPHFFELYELPLKPGSQKIVAARFRDHSPYYGDEYLALYAADKLFVTQGTDQKLEFLHRDGSLVISVKSPNTGSQSFFTMADKPSDDGSFVKSCRTILSK